MQAPEPDIHERLAGAYRLHPGAANPIAGGRPAVTRERIEALLRGRMAAEAPARLAVLFTLCSHGHRLASDLAAAAAAGRPAASADAPRLLLETARDHLRSVALDWPRRLDEQPPDIGWLRELPFPLAGSAPADAARSLRAFGEWWAGRVVEMPMARWNALTAHDEGLACWCEAQSGRLPPAGRLHGAYAVGGTLALGARPLAALTPGTADREGELAVLGTRLAAEPGFSAMPDCGGAPAENGPWLRMESAGPFEGSAWTRLAARWRELGRIAGGSARLASGNVALGPRQGLGWCEMARGLLLHWVALDAAGRIEAYRVLAPTEWNFHPRGTLACALAGLGPHGQPAARVLAAAFDPCVACTVAD